MSQPRKWLTAALSVAALAGPALGQLPLLPSTEFVDPQMVEISGYDGDAMEPFVSCDGKLLFFNSRPSAGNADLFYAKRVNDQQFDFQAPLAGANSSELDAVATMDCSNTIYFVSMRSYGETGSSIHRGIFDPQTETVTGVGIVPGVTRPLPVPSAVNFDVGVSPDGDDLYFVDGLVPPPLFVPVIADLAIARRSGDGFERLNPIETEWLLRHVNSPALEYAPALSADGLELYFTRLGSVESPTNPALFVAKRVSPNEAFGIPQHISAATGFVEAPALTPDEQGLYYHRQDEDGFHVYRLRRE